MTRLRRADIFTCRRFRAILSLRRLCHGPYRVGEGAGVGGSAGPGTSLVGVRVGVAVLLASVPTSAVAIAGGVAVGVGGVGSGSAISTALNTIVRPSARLSVQKMICLCLSRRERLRFRVGFLADFTVFLHLSFTASGRLYHRLGSHTRPGGQPNVGVESGMCQAGVICMRYHGHEGLSLVLMR